MKRSTCILGIVFLLSFSVQAGLGQGPMQIEKISPATAAPGDTVNILGGQFGKSQRKRYVRMSRSVNGKPVSYSMDVTFWSDTRISARVPSDVPSDDYLVVIYDGSPTIYSNNKKLVVTRADEKAERAQQSIKKDPVPLDRAEVGSRDADTRRTDTPPKSGMFIEKVSPAVAEPGESIEIRGRDFGRAQGNKVVAINGDNRVHVMKALDWSDSLIRARVPRDLDEGKYVVLVYYDESYRRSSNSKTMSIEAGPKGKSASSMKPDMRSSDVQAEARQSIKKDPVPLDRAEVGSRDADMRRTDTPPQGGMFIEKVSPAVTESGKYIKILGRNFGEAQGDKVVAINGDNRVHVMKVLDWSDNLIRARIPQDLDEGKYVVLVYYDESYRRSSNSKTVSIEAGPKGKSASSIKLETRSSDMQVEAQQPQDDQPPPPAVKGGIPEKKVALVLQGGGAYGAFQAGVIEALYNRGFRPSIIVGTSVGALNGAKLAEGYEGVHNDLVDLWMSLQDEGGPPLQEGSYILGKSIFLKNPRYEAFGQKLESLIDDAGTLLSVIVVGTALDPAGIGPFDLATGALASNLMQEFSELTAGLDATDSLFIQTPLAQLVTQHLSPALVAESGIQLRLASMTVDGGELRYFTETGAIESEDGQPIMPGRVAGPALYTSSVSDEDGKYIRYAKALPSVGDGVMASSAIPIIFKPWIVRGGEAYWDGAVRESLPLRKAFDLGATDVIGVLTGPMERRNVVSEPRYSIIIHGIRAIDNIDNNGADFFARVKIGDYDYIKTDYIEDDNSPNPDWRFDLNPVDLENVDRDEMDYNVTLDIWDDEHPLGRNQICDASPDDGERQIKIWIEPGSGHISGAVEGETGDKWLVRGGGEGNRVEVLFSVLRQIRGGKIGKMIPVNLMPLLRLAQLASQFHAESGIEDLRVLEPIDVLQSVAAMDGVPAALRAMRATGEEISQRSQHATGEEGQAMIHGLHIPRYLLIEAPVIVGEMIDFDQEIIRVNYRIGTIAGEHARLAILGDSIPTIEEEGQIEAEVRTDVLQMLRVEAERWAEAARQGAGTDPLMWKRHEYLTSAARQLENMRVMYPRRSRVRP